MGINRAQLRKNPQPPACCWTLSTYGPSPYSYRGWISKSHIPLWSSPPPSEGIFEVWVIISRFVAFETRPGVGFLQTERHSWAWNYPEIICESFAFVPWGPGIRVGYVSNACPEFVQASSCAFLQNVQHPSYTHRRKISLEEKRSKPSVFGFSWLSAFNYRCECQANRQSTIFQQ